MSLLSGITKVTGGGGLLGLGLFKGLGKVNATPQQDWEGAVRELGYAGAVAKYPQQAMLYGGMAPTALPGGSRAVVPYTPQYPGLLPGAQQISYNMGATPVMAGIPPLLQSIPSLGAAGAMAGRALSTVRSMLPAISKRDALSVGAIISGGIAYLNGSPVGKVRRRRRVNPLNYRAAMRAARRLCAVQDLTSRIQTALPTASSPRKKFRRRRKRRC